MSIAASSLEAFWSVHLAAEVAAMDDATVAREHASICETFASAMVEGWAPATWMWRRLSVLQAEHGRRVAAMPEPREPSRRLPVLIWYETVHGSDALPIRLSTPVLCF